MKKTLLCLLAAATCSWGSAADFMPTHPVGRTAPLPRAKTLKAPTVIPEGTPRYYVMNAYLYQSIGLEYVEGMVAKVCIDPSGQTVYISSIFPNSFRTDDMWLKGSLTPLDDGRQRITIDSKTPFFVAGWDEIYVGEAYVDEETGEAHVRDIELIMEGDHIYIDDDLNDYSRCLIAYEDDYGDIETVDVAYCLDMQPYDGNTAAVSIPDDAERRDYIYYSLDTYGALTAVKGCVATTGSDVYFDTLMPSIAPAVVKGTRQDGRINVPAGQFLGADCGYYLYSAAFFPTSFDNATGQYAGTSGDIEFEVGDDGVITFTNPKTSFITALQNDGLQYDCVYENRIVPYLGDVPATPSAPCELLVEDYSATSSTGCFAFDFVLTNLSAEGDYLNPECLGYYIYLNGERLTFSREQYGAIDADEMTLIPYGYTDAMGYDFYSAGGWNEVFIYTPSYETLGVQAVYTVDGITRESAIVTIDANGAIETIEPVGIGRHCLSSESCPDASAYDLSGRRLDSSCVCTGASKPAGVYIAGGRTIIR